MPLNNQKLNFLVDLRTATQKALDVRDDLRAIKARYDINTFGNASTGITDADLDESDFEHITNNDLQIIMSAVNTLITGFGSDTNGNDPAGAFWNLHE